jgi:hypothetical protein
MTKFEDVQDPGFVAVAGELRRWTKSLGRQQNSGPPQVRPESSGRRVLSITQGSPQFHGQTTVSGGSSFQGNFIGGGGSNF